MQETALTPLQTLRTAVDLKQEEMAERLKLSQPHYSNLENGVRKTTGDVALTVIEEFRTECTKLGLTVEDFVRGSRGQ